MRRMTIGELRRHDAPVTLVPYDVAWPALFAREAERIRGALADRALLVEHAGSTAVPGLTAKPIVDIVLAVADATDEPSYVPALEAAGYTFRIREPDWFEHRMFKGPGHRREPPRLHDGLRGDRAHAALSRPPAHIARGPRALRRGQARPGGAAVAVRAALRRREERGGSGDPRARGDVVAQPDPHVLPDALDELDVARVVCSSHRRCRRPRGARRR